MGVVRHTIWLGCVLFASATISAPFTEGNILVTSGFNTPHRVYEYTRLGSLVQTINVPTLSGQTSSDYNRDSLVDPHGRLHVFNGTFNPYISTFDPYANTWTHRTISGFSIGNSGDTGKLASFGNFVFATDGLAINGIIRLDITTGVLQRFAPQSSNDAPIDLTIGRDGLLYALNGEGSPSGRFCEVFDPTTMGLVRSFSLPTIFNGNSAQTNSIAVDSLGNLYLNQLNGPVYKMAPNGSQILASASYTRTSFVNDMDYSLDGNFMMTQSDGRVVMLDANLTEFRTFNTTNYYASGSFGAYIGPVPEPGTIAVISLGCALMAIRRRRDSS